jgi:coenzyme F420-reducing hydrogenase delta subunit
MKSFLYALLILGSAGWYITAEAGGDPIGYLTTIQQTLPTNPLAALLDGALLVGVLLLVESLFCRKKLDSVSKSDSEKQETQTAELKDDLAELQLEKRRLEDELLKVSEREESQSGRFKELEIALEDAQKKLQAAKNASSRSAGVEAELCSFLGVLQQKGRLIDFLMQDVAGYSNEQVGAAARVVHQGCAEAIKEYFQIAPVHEGSEGESISLDDSYDPLLYKILGNAPEKPPYKGKLLHRGWKTEKVTLPRVVENENGSRSAEVIAPAEVEVQAA